MSVAIRIENVSKLYRLGTVGTGTIAHDLNRWWHTIRGKEDPYAKVGQVNDRTKGSRNEERETSEPSRDSSPPVPRPSRPLAPAPDYVWALRDINLEVQQGEILGIIGRNGAGKSTLLKLLSRVTAPTTGSIKTKGRIASLLEVGTGFHPEMTGRENIYMNGAILGMRRHEITQRLDEIVEFSGCAKYLDTPVKRYSSGMTVRLGFAVAAHLQSEILIIDEVLAVGDVAFQQKCLNQMRHIATEGKTILYVSHLMHTISALCNDVAVLDNGTIAIRDTATTAIPVYYGAEHAHRTHYYSPPVAPEAPNAIWVEINDQPGSIANIGDRISFMVEFTRPVVSAVNVGFVVYSHTGDSLINANNSYLPSTLCSEDKTNNAIECRLGAVPLMPGKYRVSFWIGMRGQENKEYSQILQFQVEPRNIWNTSPALPPAVSPLWWPTEFRAGRTKLPQETLVRIEA